MTSGQAPQGFPDPLQRVLNAKTDDFSELVRLSNLDPGKDFVKGNLSGLNLSSSDLKSFNFSGTLLNGTDLSQSQLNGVELSDAKLRGANLTGTKLCGANLPDADFSGADLRRADLSGANLCRANLSHANLSDAKLNGAEVLEARFIECLGLSKTTKLYLKNQGAIFKDSAGGVNPAEEKGYKWWIRYVIVPVIGIFIGGGGIVAIYNASTSKSRSPTLAPNTQTTPSVTPIPTTKPATPKGRTQR